MWFGREVPPWLGRVAALLVAVSLTGCKTLDSPWGAAANARAEAPVADPVDLSIAPSGDETRRGLYYFHRGDYGLAERNFRAAVEMDPNNATAWIGLAGSYDNIRRFDLADRAYQAAIRLDGETVQILNNQGYSYMLRGDLPAARARFRKALRLDPRNATVWRNLHLVNAKLGLGRRSY